MTTVLLATVTDEEWPEQRRVTGFGFYVYLLSDAILFAVLFATFAVLKAETNGGPNGHALFDLHTAFIETACLLTSSFTCGVAVLAADRRRLGGTLLALALTCLLGVVFMTLELSEFGRLARQGFGPDRSAFLSACFTLVSTHGLHVTAGLLWLAFLVLQLMSRGFTEGVLRRLMCFSLFWHIIDIVWIGVFTFVYLIGSRP